VAQPRGDAPLGGLDGLGVVATAGRKRLTCNTASLKMFLSVNKLSILFILLNLSAISLLAQTNNPDIRIVGGKEVVVSQFKGSEIGLWKRFKIEAIIKEDDFVPEFLVSYVGKSRFIGLMNLPSKTEAALKKKRGLSREVTDLSSREKEQEARVAFLEAGISGAMLLADMGAEVIKVENPKGGDPFRGWDLGGDEPNFWAYNRGKRSITLNLQTPDGKDIFLKLASKADVVLDNYRPGVMKRLGIDYDTVSKTNLGVIYLSITGTGPTGPYVKRPAYDTVGQGLGGMLSLLMDAKNPRPLGPNYADSLSGMFACIGVLGAIAARAKTGRGQQVDTTMAGSILAFLIAPPFFSTGAQRNCSRTTSAAEVPNWSVSFTFCCLNCFAGERR
jgi:hypothetical protein